MWWVMFLEVIPHVLTSWFPINKEVFLFYPFLNPIKLISIAFDLVCLTVAVTMPSDAELSVLVEVDGPLILWTVIRRGTDFFPL